MSTIEYLDNLTIDQLRFARTEADRRIKAAEEKPKKIVWVVSDGCVNQGWFREEDYEKAIKRLSMLVEINARAIMEDFIEYRPAVNQFEFPRLEAVYENETEYEEWFK